jgi:hypothetical protein
MDDGKRSIVMDLNHYAMQIERDYKLSEASRNAHWQRLVDEATGNYPRKRRSLTAMFRKLVVWIKDQCLKPIMPLGENLTMKLEEAPEKIRHQA